MKNGSKTAANILIGIALFAALYFLLPRNVFSPEAGLALATIALMVYWWITRPVHIAVTALLPVLLNSVFNIVPMPSVLADYFSPVAVLLLGSGMILVCWTASGLDKRIALRALTVIGTSVKTQLVVWFFLSTLLSAFLPNAVVAAALCPIAVSMIKFSSSENSDLSKSRMLFLILLSIVWGAGLGGFGTPLGGAMNLVAISHIEALTGHEYMYAEWTLQMLPYLITLSAGVCVYLLLVKTDAKRLEGSKAYFKSEYHKIGKAKKSEILSLALFLIAVALAFTRPLYQQIVPEFKPYYAFLLMGVIAFFLKREDGQNLISWDFAAKNINWGMIILFSGGLAAGNLIISTGAADAVAAVLTKINAENIPVLIFLFILLSLFLSNASSNTAAVAVSVPVAIGITSAMSLDAMPFIFLVSAACNCAFVLPTSIRAIPVAYGMDVRFMLLKGAAALTISFVLLCVVGYLQVVIG